MDLSVNLEKVLSLFNLNKPFNVIFSKTSYKGKMNSVGMILSSDGREIEVLVQSEKVELGSILKAGDAYGIVASMRYQEDEKIGSKQKLIAVVQVFGKLVDGKIRKVKRPLPPYEKVYLAGNTELESMLGHDSESISIGYVYGTDARVYLKAGEYDRHTAVLASTGSGKSYAVANLIKEFSRLKLPVLVVDTHGEYSRLLSALAKETPMSITVYTIRHRRQGYSQLKIPVSDMEPEDFHHFVMLSEPQMSALGVIIDKLEGAGNYLIEDMIRECGRLDVNVIHEGTIQALRRKLTTLDKTFRDVFDKYGTDITKMISPGQVTIIDASLAPQSVRRSVVSYLSKEILQGRISKINEVGDSRIDYPLLFVVEEAHNYCDANLQHSCKHQLQRIASEGRKFGIGLVVVSQKPSKIDEDILSQCNTGVYMHIMNPKDKEHIRKSFESINDAIISDLDTLDVGECIIAGAMLDIPFVMCRVDDIKTSGEKRESKFSFRVPEKIKVGGFDYA